MKDFVTVVHVLLCLFLILVILLQPGKDSSQLLGGGVNSMYGQRANAHPLGRATSIIATLFMVTSITLALYSTERARSGSNVEDRRKQLEAEDAAARSASGPAPVIPAPTEAAPTDAPPTDASVQDAPVQDAPVEDAPVAPVAPDGGAATPPAGSGTTP